MNHDLPAASGRRSFLSRLNSGVASLAAFAGLAMAQETQTPAAHWEPARHAKDDWLEKPSVKHRIVFDTTSMEAARTANFFAANYIRTNKQDYGVDHSELSVVIVLRHLSAVFGYNDAMWAKYGTTLASRAKVEDPKTGKPPAVNLLNASGGGEQAPNRGVTLDSLAKQSAQFAVCTLSTRAMAGAIAHASGSTADAVFTELSNNLVANARLVPAGIVAVSRAQERGFTFVSC